ncbi:hypothetical protein L7F22_045983 [Adiantum nelumboides]|nr:hypothetical protein [Adiantum nelumboides]
MNREDEDNQEPVGTSGHQGPDDNDDHHQNLFGTGPSSRGASNEPPPPHPASQPELPASKDPKVESILEVGTNYYVPRDEAFEQAKQENFISNTSKGVVHQHVPSLRNSLKEGQEEFQSFHDIDSLFREGIKLKRFEAEQTFLQALPITHIIEKVEQCANQASSLLQYAQPSIISKDQFAWMRDEEFGRQALAGANPVHIERLQEFPPRSALDEEDYVKRQVFTPGSELTLAGNGNWPRHKLAPMMLASTSLSTTGKGMAIEDPGQQNGLKLVLEDYPYASDGILVWNAITNWVDEYVSLYYKDGKDVDSDVELQSW